MSRDVLILDLHHQRRLTGHVSPLLAVTNAILASLGAFLCGWLRIGARILLLAPTPPSPHPSRLLSSSKKQYLLTQLVSRFRLHFTSLANSTTSPWRCRTSTRPLPSIATCLVATSRTQRHARCIENSITRSFTLVRRCQITA